MLPGGSGRQLRVRLRIRHARFAYPVHMIETLNKVMQIQKQLLQELGHEPTPDEVAH